MRISTRPSSIPKRLIQEEILSDQDCDTEPSDAEGIDEYETRSDDSGTEGSLREFLNNGEVTESDYSSQEEEDSHPRKRVNASGTTTTTAGSPRENTLSRGRSIKRVILDSDSDEN
jgi:hypothetical protein